MTVEDLRTNICMGRDFDHPLRGIKKASVLADIGVGFGFVSFGNWDSVDYGPYAELLGGFLFFWDALLA